MATINGTPSDDELIGTSGSDTINGFGGNDTILADNGDDVVDGGDGHDLIRGEGGNDSLSGGNGDDYLDGGAGDDVIDGGLGIDRAAFHSSTAGVHVDLNIQGVAQDTGAGMDTLISIENLSGTTFDDVLTGNGGDNWIWGEGGNDNISAGSGNDLVEVGPGNAVADGGDGIDAISFLDQISATGAPVTVSLALQGSTQATGEGAMLLTGFENLSGGIANDVLSGDGSDNVIAGDVGNDILSGGAGNDTLYGDGRIIVDTHGAGTSGPITTYADVFALDAEPDGNDVLEGGLGDDTLDGGGGIDTATYADAAGAVEVALSPGGGFASGADGDDTLLNIENVVGSAYDDTILGDAGANTLAGGTGHDYLRGGGGNDALKGGDGDDYLDGGADNDILDGGAGIDRAAFHTSPTGVHVDLNIQGVAQDTGFGMDTLLSIENLSGTTFADTLTGNGGDNWIWGEGGNDTIVAGAGYDLVEVGPGNANANGGIGTDTISFLDDNAPPTPASVTVSLALQGGSQATGEGSMVLNGFENLSGGRANDVLSGDGANNVIAGDSGNDVLNGGSGDDTLYGDGRIGVDTHGVGTSGPITTFGDVAADLGEPDGNDTLNGGKGDDTLVGGGGDDILTGAQGKDSFVFGPDSGHDHITDFAKQDVIEIKGVAGVDSFSDLTITTNASGDAVISWGTGDDVTLDGYKAKKLSASDFSFDPPHAAATLAVTAHDAGADAHQAAMAHVWVP